MYAMLFGKYPFDATQRNFARQIVNAQYTIPQVRLSKACYLLQLWCSQCGRLWGVYSIWYRACTCHTTVAYPLPNRGSTDKLLLQTPVRVSTPCKCCWALLWPHSP